MKKIGWIFRLSGRQPSHPVAQRVAGGVGVAILLMMTGGASAQIPTINTSAPVVPDGYAVHQSVDLGGHMVKLSGSGSMYDTMINMQSGPRMLGETYIMRALQSNKHPLFDDLELFSNGYGGDPNNFTRMSVSKGKYYELNGLFRRDRQYFDYNLLANPNIIPGQTMPIGPVSSPTGSVPWPQMLNSPVMFNTVRRMTDVDLTVMPLSKVTFRAGYSHITMEGPALSPSYSIAKYDALLRQYQRNGTDDYRAGIDWKPVKGTKLTFEEEINRYKADTYMTLDPNGFIVQEADGTPAYLGNWDSQTPYGIGACNATSLQNAGQFLSAAQAPGGLPVIDPACAVVTSYMRSQPTRITLPTEILRFQSSSIKNVEMNGDFRYTLGNMNLPDYSEDVQGLNGTIRSIIYNGYANGHRAVVAADYGIVWQVSNAFSVADQINYSSVQQPGIADLPQATTYSTPNTAGNQTITYSGPLTKGNAYALPHGIEGFPYPGYFGQSFVTNNFTMSWDATSRATFSLTYRASQHKIGQGVPHTGPINEDTDPTSGTVTINENGAIFNAALRPTAKWNLDGSIGFFYNDNALTPIGFRQSKHYRIHSMYRPKNWATVSMAYVDRERSNNTNNTGVTPLDGPIDHVDHSRVASIGTQLFPNDRYGFNLNYAYSDVYTATNICYTPQSTPTVPGAATESGTACPGATVRGASYLEFGPARDFMDAPTQSGSFAFTVSPVKSVHSNIGYNISSVSGSRFYNDARDVAGSLVSTYQSPFVNFAWTSRPGLTWNAEYNFYGYGEGGPSGAEYCSTGNPTATTPATVVPCSSLPNTARSGPAWGYTAPRNFHSNMVTLSVHYEF